MNIFHYILLSMVIILTTTSVISKQTNKQGRLVGIVSGIIFIVLIILSGTIDCACAVLIVMAVHDTEENGRSEFTKRTLFGGVAIVELHPLINSVNWDDHRMIIVDNNSCEETKITLIRFRDEVNRRIMKRDDQRVVIIPQPKNIGTAAAVNKGIAFRQPGEHVVKMDNDAMIGVYDWLEQMQDVMQRMPNIGILGLKRVDLLENPYAINTDQRSRLLMVPHETGQRWRIVEEAKHIMGTCTMLSPALLDRVGYFTQPNLYGFDDSLMCVRSQVAGFINCFLPHIDIDHIDPGGTAYAKWKEEEAGRVIDLYGQEEAAYRSGVKDVYYNGE